ncbi:hypothetical protein C8R32_1238 [Nitrosospira sp. Nsp5]|uniref:Uncharacterized protein n=1 Tax=Nitrosospira multiformis TaxID=1231 RepID=A0ABY0TIJ5_9PROT|nr:MULTISPECIES: hypothetical protein [Nitrosospira]PTR05344.1 hypothetical protein C8R32_1238 [Nitrosospira sp. Nsp5]SDQ66746.1 hypothetical protein SAMN05216402_1770 [Nitrosospira multiformis]
MDLDTSGRDLLDMAGECMDRDDLGNARELIAMAIAQAPANGNIVFDASGLFRYAELYSSARKVIEDFHERTGLKLYMSVDREEIIQWEQANQMIDDVPVFDLAEGPLQFKRLSDLERGSFSSYVTTSTPVEFIEASEQGLAITQSRTKYEFKWDEIARASIVTRTIYKGVGLSSTHYPQKICTLEAPGRLFQFDVSSTYPDFRGVVLLRAILTRYLNMEFIDERKPGFKVAKDDPIRNLKREHLIRMGLIAGGIILFSLFLHFNQTPS